MLKRLATTIVLTAFAGTIASAQAAKPAEAQKASAAKTDQPRPAPEPAALPVNIKFEVTITDQSGDNPPAKKVVTMIASDRQPTNVRSSASVPVKSASFAATPGGVAPPSSYTYRTVQINVDARPAIVAKEPNKVSVNFGLEYFPTGKGAQDELQPGLTSWNERLSVILESGKPMIVSQAADPTSDRKITVEVTATILK